MQFAPAVYEHAARLIDRSPWKVSRDPDLLFRAHAEAYRTYGHRPVVVGIDIYNLEAEACGATVAEPEGNAVPAVSGHVCSSAADIMDLPPLDPGRDGRVPMVIETAGRLAREFPEADVRVPVSGCFSVAANLAGFENLLFESVSDPESVGKALEHLARGQVAFCEEAESAGVGITVFETAAAPPMISPALFREIVLPSLKEVMGEAGRIVGRPVSLIVGGDTCPILDCLLETNPGFLICPSETDQNAFMETLRERPEIAARVSMDPQLLAAGDLEGIYREADRIMDLIADRENTTVGAGVIPYETDPGVVLKAMEYVSRR
jgi:uroporphyrinogen decarboxylase